ncbi:pyruvate dehydrogenase (acetyl-transferring) E1 component subunit alpha [Thermoleophilia bacterium SCSIO 60948]|nr:pyruvate dehydrogenase (acetyl-transferring) E1 component subunit alpha [Thermoleophilia bacterium SCSIO 60948]
MTVHASPAEIETDQLLGMLERMYLIRRFETEAERQYKQAKIGGYCHLSSGQEATCVGTMDAMTDDDLLVTGYRSHGFALARHVPATEVMAELFGRVDGCARGRGGSMHLLDPDLGYYGGWGIVGGQLPVATGLALALVRQERPAAVLCELGDGAVNMGAWHESLNLASLWDLPIVYLVVNNIYGMGTSVERASAEPELFRRAHAHRMVGERIDGDDIEEVHAATSELLQTARDRHRPAVLEALTYRYRGHSVADAGLSYRDRDEIKEHQERDPIKRVRSVLSERGVEDEQLDAADERAQEQVAEAVEFADASPEPPLDQLAYGMYAKGSDKQFARMRPGSPFGERELVFDAGLGD